MPIATLLSRLSMWQALFPDPTPRHLRRLDLSSCLLRSEPCQYFLQAEPEEEPLPVLPGGGRGGGLTYTQGPHVTYGNFFLVF